MDSESQIIEDSQKDTKPFGFQGVASDKDKHRKEGLATQELHLYADATGQYLSNVIEDLEKHKGFFENQQDMRAADLFLDSLADIRTETVEIINLDRPKAFNSFHEIHLSMLVELDILDRVLEDLRDPFDTKQIESARVHYENSIIAFKNLEREWFSVSEEYGIY